ncbi:unnamed protein product [Ilex paraguariensis]|uniref:Receptor-like serine/threonine-protein kinase n=1 Tax=Ilex paraguariensis TaxID=185542 RepID=A0ABC8R313_9AQUA
MGSLFTSFTAHLLLLSCALLPQLTHSGGFYVNSIPTNFTASHFQFIDHSGVFLASQNGTFKASITNQKPEDKSFYLVVLHSPSGVFIWSANRNSPISNSGKVHLSDNGLTIVDDAGKLIWSTTPLSSPVSSLHLQESGNLVLFDHFNNSLWESFDHPTDTIVTGQRLRVNQSLISAANETDISEGDYRFKINTVINDAVMEWNGLTYWQLSMDGKANRNSNLPGTHMEITSTGLYLLGANGSSSMFVVQVKLQNSSGLRMVKLEQGGSLSIKSSMSNSWEIEFTGPVDSCRIPYICKKIGLCGSRTCSCPPGFHSDPKMDGDCTPTDSSLTLPSSSSCNASGNGTEMNNGLVSYMKLGNGKDYFANDYIKPVKVGVSLSACESLCSQNCSCLGIFHGNSSGSCYLLENYLGSIISISTTQNDRIGYIKAIGVSNSIGDGNDQKSTNFPIVGLILLPPSVVVFIFVFMGIIWLRIRKKWSRNGGKKLGHGRSSSSSTELEIILIPGLPMRFDYEELVTATDNFTTQIGTGGFGTVFKGTLPDNTEVAVKKITCIGNQGKKEFCTEIAIIGKIHHVNLVTLKGFCAQEGQRFLVYEYMNRGSLDRSLFGNGALLEWRERLEIALGTARGLAYLHSGCEHKIIHCDVKPENILLHGQSQVKISDFGLSKLLSPEESGLFTTMRGTRGYLAPEWLTSSAISDKTDVYSYGMVLLEIVRGKKNCSLQTQSHRSEDDHSHRGNNSCQVYFPLFALEMHQERRYSDLADPRLEGQVTNDEVEKLVRVALCCVHEEPMLRPTMSSVVGMLEGVLPIGEPRVLPIGEPRVDSLKFLRFYGRRFTEASTIEGHNEENELTLEPRVDIVIDSSTSGSHHSCSYISSQQISGPR